MSSAANSLPSQVRALTHNLSAQEADAYKSKLPVLNQSYTYQNIIIKFVEDIITINTTLVNHDNMADVIEKLTNLGVQRPCLSHLTSTLIHANKTFMKEHVHDTFTWRSLEWTKPSMQRQHKHKFNIY